MQGSRSDECHALASHFDAFEESLGGRAAALFEDRAMLRADGPSSPALEAAAMQLARQHAHWLTTRQANTHRRFVTLRRLEERFEA